MVDDVEVHLLEPLLRQRDDILGALQPHASQLLPGLASEAAFELLDFTPGSV